MAPPAWPPWPRRPRGRPGWPARRSTRPTRPRPRGGSRRRRPRRPPWPTSSTAPSASPRSTGSSGCRSVCGRCASPTATTGSTSGPWGGQRDGGRLMDFGELLAGRRSTRHFDTGRDVDDDVLARVLAAPLAMPHAGNTYDWRGVVLRRRDRDPAMWPAVYSALLEQSYVEEAAAGVGWAGEPGGGAGRYRASVAE